MTGTILIIDDEEGLRKLLSRIIGLEGFQVEEAATIKEGFDTLKRKEVDVILCDVKLPDGNGVDFVKEVKTKYPLSEIILLTAFGNIQDGVRAMKNGGFDYITKGNDNDRIVPLIYQAMDKVAAQKKSSVKIKEKGTFHFNDIIGHSAGIQQAIELAKRIAPTDTNVLLLGGKRGQEKRSFQMPFIVEVNVPESHSLPLIAALLQKIFWKVNYLVTKQVLTLEPQKIRKA